MTQITDISFAGEMWHHFPHSERAIPPLFREREVQIPLPDLALSGTKPGALP